MTVIGVLTLLVALALIALAALNLAALAAPVNLSFVVAHREVPLGLVLVVFGAVVAAVFAAYLLRLQLRSLSAARRNAVEIRRQRELAETAESSRSAELRAYLERELHTLMQQQQAMEQRLHQEITNGANSLAASIAEVDDRLQRQWSTPPTRGSSDPAGGQAVTGSVVPDSFAQ